MYQICFFLHSAGLRRTVNHAEAFCFVVVFVPVEQSLSGLSAGNKKESTQLAKLCSTSVWRFICQKRKLNPTLVSHLNMLPENNLSYILMILFPIAKITSMVLQAKEAAFTRTMPCMLTTQPQPPSRQFHPMQCTIHSKEQSE